jgi:anti-sigma28 factor (negative regulator of flagellin synthesis)
MRDTSARHWKCWRVTLSTAAITAVDRFERKLVTATDQPDAPEQPGPDGIRHELVARIRQQIAAGTYDTEEKWRMAEEAMFRRMEEFS